MRTLDSIAYFFLRHGSAFLQHPREIARSCLVFEHLNEWALIPIVSLSLRDVKLFLDISLILFRVSADYQIRTSTPIASIPRVSRIYTSWRKTRI